MMKEIDIQISGCKVSQEQAQQIGQVLAQLDNPDTMVISRFNCATNACSPCCLKGTLGGKPGWEIYGETHGGRLKITVNNGAYIFIFS